MGGSYWDVWRKVFGCVRIFILRVEGGVSTDHGCIRIRCGWASV